MPIRIGQAFFMNYFQIFQHFSWHPAGIPFFQIALLLPLYKLPTSSNYQHFLDQELFFSFSSWQNHCNLLCEHSLKIFSDNMFWVSPAEILSCGLTLHIHLTILASFLSSLITLPSSTDKVWLPHSVPIHVPVVYVLPFASTSKTLLIGESGKNLTLLYPFLVLATT